MPNGGPGEHTRKRKRMGKRKRLAQHTAFIDTITGWSRKCGYDLPLVSCATLANLVVDRLAALKLSRKKPKPRRVVKKPGRLVKRGRPMAYLTEDNLATTLALANEVKERVNALEGEPEIRRAPMKPPRMRVVSFGLLYCADDSNDHQQMWQEQHERVPLQYIDPMTWWHDVHAGEDTRETEHVVVLHDAADDDDEGEDADDDDFDRSPASG